MRSEIGDIRAEIREFMLWGFGITFAGIFALIGFVLWDKRTVLAPAKVTDCAEMGWTFITTKLPNKGH